METTPPVSTQPPTADGERRVYLSPELKDRSILPASIRKVIKVRFSPPTKGNGRLPDPSSAAGGHLRRSTSTRLPAGARNPDEDLSCDMFCVMRGVQHVDLRRWHRPVLG